MIKACIFDLDGTLLNTLPTIMHYGNLTLSSYGLAPYGLEDYKGFIGDGARNLVKSMLAGRGAPEETVEPFLKDYLTAYDRAPHVGTVPYEGIRELLDLLLADGCRLAVISNKPNSSVSLLVERFFPADFSLVSGMTGNDPLELKPNTLRLDRLLADWSCTPDECLYLGDGIPDMTLATAAGLGLPIAALWGFTQREELLSHGGIPAESPYDVIALYKGTKE